MYLLHQRNEVYSAAVVGEAMAPQPERNTNCGRNSFFGTTRPDHDNNIAIALRQFPEINISVLANQIGINKSLLTKYIYEIKRPSAVKKKEIENALHILGEKLLTVEL